MSEQMKSQNKDLADALRSVSADIEQEREKEIAFQEKAILLKHQTSNDVFYAVVNLSKKIIYYNMGTNLLVGDRLYDEATKSVFVVSSIRPDRFNMNLTADNKQYIYTCTVAEFLYDYEMPDAGRNSMLAKLKTQIQESNDSLLIKRKPKALKLFDDFKLCITNNERDNTLFESFLKILKALSPSAAHTAELIIEDAAK